MQAFRIIFAAFWAALGVAVLAGAPARAQSLEWTDTIMRIEDGQAGMELHLRIDRPTDDLGRAHVMRGICNHFLPAAMPLVRTHTAVTDPRFVSLRIATRSWDLVLGAGGRWQTTYDIEDGTCGRERRAERQLSNRGPLAAN